MAAQETGCSHQIYSQEVKHEHKASTTSSEAQTPEGPQPHKHHQQLGSYREPCEYFLVKPQQLGMTILLQTTLFCAQLSIT